MANMTPEDERAWQRETQVREAEAAKASVEERLIAALERLAAALEGAAGGASPAPPYKRR